MPVTMLTTGLACHALVELVVLLGALQLWQDWRLSDQDLCQPSAIIDLRGPAGSRHDRRARYFLSDVTSISRIDHGAPSLAGRADQSP